MRSQRSSYSVRNDPSGRLFCSLSLRGRAITGWICEEDFISFGSGLPYATVKRESFLLPGTFSGATVAQSDGKPGHMGRAAFLKNPVFPAVLSYSHGRNALAVHNPGVDGIMVAPSLSFAGLMANSFPFGDDEGRAGYEKALNLFRVLYARDLFGDEGAISTAAKSAMEKISPCGIPLYARGEPGEYFVYAFCEGEDGYSVAGITKKPLTLTLQFPFLEAGARYRAEWVDDGLDYYVKDGFEIRPGEVSAKTRAVVKTSQCGGFLVRLCGRL